MKKNFCLIATCLLTFWLSAQTINVNPSNLSGFTTVAGSNSPSGSFTVSGSGLTANIVITAPADFEISINDISFTGALALTQSGGTVANTAIYVRIKSTAAVGSSAGNVVASSTGATNQNVAVSGTVLPKPVITVTPDALASYSTTQGTASSGQAFMVDGANLLSDIVVTPPYGYEVSLDGTNYFTSLNLSPSSGTISSVNVFVRLTAKAPVATINNNVTVTSNSAVDKTVALGGSVTAAAPVPFTVGNLIIYRVGNGASALAGEGTEVYLEEFTPAGTLVQSVPMPTTVSGFNRRLVAYGIGADEGLITRSNNGYYLVVTGYDASPGANVLSSPPNVDRVVGRLTNGVTINTSTAISDMGSSANLHSAASPDGINFWLANSSGIGVRYTSLGFTTSTSLNSVTSNFGIAVADGQLYTSSGSSGLRITTVGFGTPTTSGQTLTNLPGIPTSGILPRAFFFADLDATVPGIDVLYFADRTSNAGVRKYSLVSGNWVSNGNIAMTGTCTGLAGQVSGSTVTLYATDNAHMYTATDGSGYNGTMTATATLLAIPSINTAFRGIAFTPNPLPLPVSFSGFKAVQKTNGIELSWNNDTEENISRYSIERSANGRSFSSIGTSYPDRNNNGKASYTFLDGIPFAGDNFYRIRASEISGKESYTNIIRINTHQKGTGLAIYPNPVKDGDVSIQLNNLAAGKYSIAIYNAAGQRLTNQNFEHAGGSVTETLNVSQLKAGLYSVHVNGNVKLQKSLIVY
jgi:hypothetical protein